MCVKAPAQGVARRDLLEHQEQLLFSDKRISLPIVLGLKSTSNSSKEREAGD